MGKQAALLFAYLAFGPIV